MLHDCDIRCESLKMSSNRLFESKLCRYKKFTYDYQQFVDDVEDVLFSYRYMYYVLCCILNYTVTL